MNLEKFVTENWKYLLSAIGIPLGVYIYKLFESKATKVAKLNPTLIGNRLIISNNGISKAWSIKIKLGDNNLQDHPIYVKEPLFPDIVESGQSISYLVAISTSTPKPPYLIEILWEDESGKKNSFQGVLTL